MFSFAILGGMLLNIGAYFTYKGQIYQSVMAYIFADICWMIMAYEKQDAVGAVLIMIGTVFGFLAFLKMRDGSMRKSLSKDE